MGIARQQVDFTLRQITHARRKPDSQHMEQGKDMVYRSYRIRVMLDNFKRRLMMQDCIQHIGGTVATHCQ